MVRNEFTFPSADGKTAIHAVEWLPAGTPRGVVQLSHGVAEYVDRYDGFARYLAEREKNAKLVDAKEFQVK